MAERANSDSFVRNKYLMTLLTRMAVNYCEKERSLASSSQSHFMNHQTDTFNIVNQTIESDRKDGRVSILLSDRMTTKQDGLV